MERRVVTIAIILLGLLSSSARAQVLVSNVLNLTGSGARAAAMGQAFVGVADDATAISWNPAGLTVLKKPEASVVGRVIAGSTDIELPASVATLFDTQIETESKFTLNFASGIVPFVVSERNVVAGVAFRRWVDPAQTTTLKLTPKSPGLTGAEVKSEITGGINAISPSVGVQVASSVSVGATVNILTGTETDRVLSNGVEQGKEKTKHSGTFFDVGGLVHLSPKFSVGAVFSTAFTLTQEPQDVIGAEKTELKIPAFWSFGAAFKPTDRLTIAGDFRLRKWSDTKIKDPETGEEVEIGFEDANSFHAGLEYLIFSGTTVIPLRAGFYTLPLQAREYDPNAPEGQGDQITGSVFTFGAGLIVGSVNLDAAFEVGGLEYKVFDADLGQLNVKETNARLSLGAVIHFGK